MNDIIVAITGKTGRVDGYLEVILGGFQITGILIDHKLSKSVAADETTLYIDAKLGDVALGHLGTDDIPLREPADTPNADPRQPVIDAYNDLDDTITDYYDDFRDDKLTLMAQDWIKYAAACIDAGEGYFALRDIHSDDMEFIPHGYPKVKPELPTLKGEDVGGMYDTPRARRIQERMARR